MPIIVKNAGSIPAPVDIFEISSGKKDGVTIMPSGKVTLQAGWDVSPASVLTNSRLVVHRVPDPTPPAASAPVTPKVSAGKTSTTN